MRVPYADPTRDTGRSGVPGSIRQIAIGLTALASLSACGEQGLRPSMGAAPAMYDGAQSLAPQGWIEYCGRNPDDASCQAAALTPERVEQLQQVQATTWKIPRKSDSQLFGKAEFWQIADRETGGDCEDIALAARQQLLGLGWPVSALRLATAWTERGEYHLILTVDVFAHGQRETLVLDSRFPQITSYGRLQKIGYRFETRQAAHGPGWVKVDSAPYLARVEMASSKGVEAKAGSGDATASVAPRAPAVAARKASARASAAPVELAGIEQGNRAIQVSVAAQISALSSFSGFAGLPGGMPDRRIPDTLLAFHAGPSPLGAPFRTD